MTLKLTRQQIYDRIKVSSKDSYVLTEMKRMGFWDSSQPTLPEELINRETDIIKELDKLQKLDNRFKDQEALLLAMRKERMKKAKAKREQTKQANEQKSIDKAARWKLIQQQQIIYLGQGVSGGLRNTSSNRETLDKYKLPFFENIQHLAQSMGVDLAGLRYLLYHRNVSKDTHYHSFTIPKKSGGVREISAPKSKLKHLQYWVLNNILNVIPDGEYAHGFIPGKSICTNALPHVAKDIVINIDLQNFFPTITYKRIKGLFVSLGYSEQQATIFSLICTEIPCDKVEMDGVLYYVQKSERVLPQGSPASPAISNLIASRLDKKMHGLATKYNFTYTRYADDLTFSSQGDTDNKIAGFLYFVEKIIRSEGFTIHPDKTAIMRKGRQQRVTGIVVNEKMNVPRVDQRKFRALLHNIETNGWANKSWKGSDNLFMSVKGYIAFVNMVNAEKGLLFSEQLKRIIEKYGAPVVEMKNDISANCIKEVELHVPKIQAEEDTKEADNNWWNIL